MSQHESEAEEKLRQELRQYLAGLTEQATLAPDMRERIRSIPTRYPLDIQGKGQASPLASKNQQGHRPRQSGRSADVRRPRGTFWVPSRNVESSGSGNAERLLSTSWKSLVAYCRNELGDATLAGEVVHLVAKQCARWRVAIAAGRKPAQLTAMECWLLMYAYHDWLWICACVECTRLKRKAGAHRFSEREGATRRTIAEADSTHQLTVDLIAHISDRLTEEDKTFIHAMLHRGTDKAMPEVQAIAERMGVSVTTIHQRVAQLRRKIRALREALAEFKLDGEQA